eukprot:CAMPEP_0184384034 /NCGR_PEP_ID=MMETSP0007-20130409/7607_1 /TAXON_ID=97485 /ORGANISM="Prymnesium parvum, Strain Texoma1" /LENGTH=63 /DNA_ID=CAMNT_0026730759 /DNA_START=511 /DNA_END=702 /DNA_ORIENTATION=-
MDAVSAASVWCTGVVNEALACSQGSGMLFQRLSANPSSSMIVLPRPPNMHRAVSGVLGERGVE